MRKTFILPVMILLFAFCISAVQVEDSYINESCEIGDFILFNVTDKSNALASLDDADFSVCFNSTPETLFIVPGSEQGDLVVSLYNDNNSLVSASPIEGGNYIFIAGFDSYSIECKPKAQCEGNEGCVVGLYQGMESRVTECNDSEALTKICCAVASKLNPVGFPKPHNYEVATNWPALFIETNRPASCSYDLDNAGWQLFKHTGNTKYHESVVYASEGSHSFDVKCTADESLGDSFIWSSVSSSESSFNVDSSCVTSLASMSDLNVLPGALTALNVSAGCSEIHHSNFKFFVNGSSVDAGIRDNRDGNYIVSFTAPKIGGIYNFTIKLFDQSESASLTVLSDNTTIKISHSSVNKVSDHIASDSDGNYVFGIASDASNADASSGSVSFNYRDGIGYLFITKSSADVTRMDDFLAKKQLSSLQNPSFGYALKTGSSSAISRLSYDDIKVAGNSTLYPGSYSVVLKNKGIDPLTGKILVEVNVLR